MTKPATGDKRTSNKDEAHIDFLELETLPENPDEDSQLEQAARASSMRYTVTTIDATAFEDMALELELEESSSQNSLDVVGSYVFQKELEAKPDFFEVLGQVPNLEDISRDPSLVTMESLRDKSMQEEVPADSGKFVDPLTGDTLSSEEDIAIPRPDDFIDEEEIDDAVAEDLLILPDIVEDAELEQALPAEDLFGTFFEAHAKKQVQIAEEMDFKELERAHAAQELEKSIQEFLNDLMTNTVDLCEYVDPNIVLRQNLDKAKLMKELKLQIDELKVEHRARQFLNRKTVEYFRRKKSFRQFSDSSSETLAADRKKFLQVTLNLDQLLGRKEETKRITVQNITKLTAEVQEMKKTMIEGIESLENLVRKTFVRESFERIKLVVEQQLRKMRDLRNEISKTRYVLIQRQHTLATLMGKSEKLENLGNDLRMRDFEHLQTETQALGKKIEERNSELNKLRMRFNADVHIMAHMIEKKQMLRNTIEIQKAALEDLLDEKLICREFLFDLKMDRGKMRKEIQELSFQGGLVDKPALMVDYDETVERKEKLMIKVDQLRAKYAEILAKLEILQNKCGSVGTD